MRSVIIAKTLLAISFTRALFASTGRRGASTKRRFLGVVFFALIGFSTWAGVSEFDQVISGEAKVVPSQLQTIQHFEGGIVKDTRPVRDGRYLGTGTHIARPAQSPGPVSGKTLRVHTGTDPGKKTVRRTRGG